MQSDLRPALSLTLSLARLPLLACAQVTYLKMDTCAPPQIDYRVMRDALNATGTDIFFSLCEPGQGPTTAPTGRQVGNGWRIDEDDGQLWRPILDNVNMNAPLFPYAGCDAQHGNDGAGCGWNDMGLVRSCTTDRTRGVW